MFLANYQRILAALAGLTLLLLTGCGDEEPASGSTQPIPSPTTTSTVAVIQPSATPAEPSPTIAPPTATPSPPPDATATASPTPEPFPSIGLELVVDGLAAPIGFAVANDGTNRLFILEQEGRVQAVADGQRLGTPFLDIVDRVGSSSPEQGLLGLAFHPNYPENGYFYVNYTDRSGNTVVARYQVTEDANLADPASEVVLLAVEQPAGNHNGGHLVFGPDGYLYIGLGDGGGAGDTYGNAQNLGTLLGAILRIDVDGGEPYAIPPDNPFVGRSEARPEIWAYGLRNPWRFSFDWENGDLWIADVGQNQYEEVNVLPANLGGQNYGWPMMEGLRCFEAETCDQEGLVLPVAEYDHGLGCSVTGGYVYRGAAFPNLQGVYFFGDYCSGHVWGMVNHGAGWQTELLVEESGLSISSFGQDEAGELYLVDQGGGLYRIVQQ